MFIQQGDVKFHAIEEIPSGAKEKKCKDYFVFAEGEQTGHSHKTKVTYAEPSRMYILDGKLFFENEKPVKITHEEHHTQTLPAGKWGIDIVKEYDPFEDEIREVQD